ncbi:phosphatase PAP2 family protein [Mycolicibacterium cyprinidarum]|uniref:Phosphatase PAP2 family protein n=1 Tax=Mycolicibacterium cyprinidarum TaxID=2860311 RepID=A0ABQ4VCW1_9MYCO|nr:phosphatase PAP2 family protein [Mycolicibacterium sp. NGTWS0302]GJF17286.1 phosphatase PAP2 family protein [Mycolicibacterium sp. NGTWSNA01]GJF18352.1 phosphatase PAP2 family protein [Mycolicibacterium sp. NGTWS1803]
MAFGGFALFRRGRFALFFLAAGLFAALGALAVGINAEWLAALDASVETWFESHRSRSGRVDATGIFRFVGSPVHVVSVAAVCGGLLSLRARSVIPAVLVIGGVGFGVVAEHTLKAIVGRTSTAVAELQGKSSSLHQFEHSFPSGHVTANSALLGLIAVCLGVGWTRAAQTVLAVTVAAGVLFIVFVTLYAEAHTCTDVIGGMILGGAIVALGAGVLGATTSRRVSFVAPTDARSPSYT